LSKRKGVELCVGLKKVTDRSSGRGRSPGLEAGHWAEENHDYQLGWVFVVAASIVNLFKEAAFQLFQMVFDDRRVSVGESYETYDDSLDGHWSWWLRIEGHFVQLQPEKRAACDREVKDALETLRTPAGIPYTIHMLHVKL